MNRVSAERKLKGLTQEQLAQNLAVDRTTIVRWETGESIPDKKLVAMRDVFGCDIDWLLGLSDERRTVS